MKNYTELKCTSCKKCNSIGKPSVMKGSAYCQSRRGMIPSASERLGKNRPEYFLSLLKGMFSHLSPKQFFKMKKTREEAW